VERKRTVSASFWTVKVAMLGAAHLVLRTGSRQRARSGEPPRSLELRGRQGERQAWRCALRLRAGLRQRESEKPGADWAGEPRGRRRDEGMGRMAPGLRIFRPCGPRGQRYRPVSFQAGPD